MPSEWSCRTFCQPIYLSNWNPSDHLKKKVILSNCNPPLESKTTQTGATYQLKQNRINITLSPHTLEISPGLSTFTKNMIPSKIYKPSKLMICCFSSIPKMKDFLHLRRKVGLASNCPPTTPTFPSTPAFGKFRNTPFPPFRLIPQLKSQELKAPTPFGKSSTITFWKWLS